MSGLWIPDIRTSSCAAVMSDAPSHARKVVTDWSTLPGGIVDGGEIVLLAVKPSMWRPVLDSAAWLVTCWVLAAVIGVMGTPIPGMSLMVTVQAVLFVGFAGLAVAFVRWAPMWYVLTNRRVLDVQGVRAPRIASCLLIDVRNTYLNSTSTERMAGLGTITFVTDLPDESPRAWQSIARPEEVHDRIRRAIENAIDQQGV